jgi:hypothetical protein
LLARYQVVIERLEPCAGGSNGPRLTDAVACPLNRRAQAQHLTISQVEDIVFTPQNYFLRGSRMFLKILSMSLLIMTAGVSCKSTQNNGNSDAKTVGGIDAPPGYAYAYHLNSSDSKTLTDLSLLKRGESVCGILSQNQDESTLYLFVLPIVIGDSKITVCDAMVTKVINQNQKGTFVNHNYFSYLSKNASTQGSSRVLEFDVNTIDAIPQRLYTINFNHEPDGTMSSLVIAPSLREINVCSGSEYSNSCDFTIERNSNDVPILSVKNN